MQGGFWGAAGRHCEEGNKSEGVGWRLPAPLHPRSFPAFVSSERWQDKEGSAGLPVRVFFFPPFQLPLLIGTRAAGLVPQDLLD